MSDLTSIDERLRQMYAVLSGPEVPEPQVPLPSSGQPPAMRAGAISGETMAPADVTPPTVQVWPVPDLSLPPPNVGAPLVEPEILAGLAATYDADAEAKAIVTAAEAEAARILDEAGREVQELKRQIDELIVLREHLRAAPAETGGLPVSPGATAPSPAHAHFAGVVTLTVGPLSSTEAIERFEAALVTIAALDDVYLRAYESGRAMFELRLRLDVDLLDAVVRISPEPITVLERSARSLVISLGAPPPSARTTP